jgi:acylphosphatase
VVEEKRLTGEKRATVKLQIDARRFGVKERFLVPTERVHIRVRGRVQGVSFRASTAMVAERLGLTGWVRNCDDGSVELEAEGDKAQLTKLVSWCGRGPSAARVTDVHSEWSPPTGAEKRFAVKY